MTEDRCGLFISPSRDKVTGWSYSWDKNPSLWYIAVRCDYSCFGWCWGYPRIETSSVTGWSPWFLTRSAGWSLSEIQTKIYGICWHNLSHFQLSFVKVKIWQLLELTEDIFWWLYGDGSTSTHERLWRQRMDIRVQATVVWKQRYRRVFTCFYDMFLPVQKRMTVADSDLCNFLFTRVFFMDHERMPSQTGGVGEVWAWTDASAAARTEALWMWRREQLRDHRDVGRYFYSMGFTGILRGFGWIWWNLMGFCRDDPTFTVLAGSAFLESGLVHPDEAR